MYNLKYNLIILGMIMGFCEGFNLNSKINENKKENVNVPVFEIDIENSREVDLGLSYDETTFNINGDNKNVSFTLLKTECQFEWYEKGYYFFDKLYGIRIDVKNNEEFFVFDLAEKGDATAEYSGSNYKDNVYTLYKTIINSSEDNEENLYESIYDFIYVVYGACETYTFTNKTEAIIFAQTIEDELPEVYEKEVILDEYGVVNCVVSSRLIWDCSFENDKKQDKFDFTIMNNRTDEYDELIYLINIEREFFLDKFDIVISLIKTSDKDRWIKKGYTFIDDCNGIRLQIVKKEYSDDGSDLEGVKSFEFDLYVI